MLPPPRMVKATVDPDDDLEAMAPRSQPGFTLVELLVVLLVVALLIAIAVPSYLGMRGRSADSAAQASVRTIGPAIGAYYNDNGTYVGMTVGRLRRNYDRGLPRNRYGLRSLTATSYCVEATVSGQTWNKVGPAGTIAAGSCP
jgi:prepilin-type N-terminal cleavage/methylation domain-containing protein